MDNQAIPPVTEIIPMYEVIYPPETVEAVYSYLRERIETLKPIVENSEKTPIVTDGDEHWEPGEKSYEIEKRDQNNILTKQTLEDCEAAWDRLIGGSAHQCVSCERRISKDRKQAQPQASKCTECQKKVGLRVS